MSTPRYFHYDTNNPPDPPEEQRERRNSRPLRFYEVFGDNLRSRGRRRGSGSSRYRSDNRQYGYNGRGGRPTYGYQGGHHGGHQGWHQGNRRWSDEPSSRQDGRHDRWRDGRESEQRRGLGADGEYQGSRSGNHRCEAEPKEEDAAISQLRQPISSYIDERDENRTKDKKRKYVKGGRIAQLKKEQEFSSGSLYCDVCERYFHDDNAKACHDKSKDHRTRVSQKRVALESEVRRKKAKVEESPMKKEIMGFTADEVRAVLNKKMPAKFREWANRSLEAAKTIAREDHDPNTVLAVMREIVHEFKIHTENCTIYVESWMRRPEATGRHYRTVEPTTFSTLVHTEEEAEKMVAADPPPEKSNEQPSANPTNEPSTVDEGTSEKRRSRWVRGETVDDSVRKPTSVVQTDEQRRAETNVVGPTDPTSAGIQEIDIAGVAPRSAAESSTAAEPPKQVIIRWQMSSAAERILYANKDRNPGLISARAKTRFAWKKPSEEMADDEKDSVESTVKQYKKVRGEFDRRDYNYKTWREEIEGVVSVLTKRGTRSGTLQSCYQMMAKAGIQAEDWGGCFAACDELMQTCKWKGHLDDNGKEVIGQWILLSLFKSLEKKKKRVPRGKQSSRFLELNSRLRDLPLDSLDESSAYDCWQLWTAVLTNNYVKFFRMKRDGCFYTLPGGRVDYIIEELEDTVRERAIRTIALSNEAIEGRVYAHGMAAFNMAYLMRILGWEDSSDRDDNVDEGLAKAREFVEGIGQGVKIGGNEAHGKSGMVLGSNEIAVMKDDEVIDTQTVLWMDRKFMKSQVSGEKQSGTEKCSAARGL